MNNQQFAEVVDRQIAECREILGVKGLDYPMDAGDRLSNFKHSGARSGTTAMQAWLVFFLKHEECIEKFVRGEYHDSEPIFGRIADAINYLLLLRALIEEAQTEGADPTPPASHHRPVEGGTETSTEGGPVARLRRWFSAENEYPKF